MRWPPRSLRSRWSTALVCHTDRVGDTTRNLVIWLITIIEDAVSVSSAFISIYVQENWNMMLPATYNWWFNDAMILYNLSCKGYVPLSVSFKLPTFCVSWNMELEIKCIIFPSAYLYVCLSICSPICLSLLFNGTEKLHLKKLFEQIKCV